MALPGAGGITLKVGVTINGTAQEKTMRFNADMAIWEVCKEVAEKLNIGGADHGLFQAASGTRKGRWFKPNVTLKGAELLSGVRHHILTHFYRVLLCFCTLPTFILSSTLSPFMS